MTESTLGPLTGHPVVPVLVIDDAEAAGDVAGALQEGGIACAEVTLRTAAAIAAIRHMADVPGFLVGAGTVLSEEQVEMVADAGARFVVSPGLDEGVVERARVLGLGVLPGAATATEIMRAQKLGIDTVKFFPADVLGGRAAIRSLAGPFPTIGFVPSGGVTADNAAAYLAEANVAAVSGSWMAPRQLIADRDLATITRLSARSPRGGI